MGALTVISRTAAPDVTARVRETLSRRGFEAPEIIETKGHTLLLHGGMVSGEAMLLEREESGDFAAAAGTLLYKGQYGRAALLEFLNDARKGEEDEEALAGCYVILLSLSGRLRLAVDRLGLYKVHCLADGSVWSSSFLAAAAALKERRFDEQAVYEFVFQGATYGGATVLQDVTLLSPDRWHSLTPGEPDRERPFPFTLKVEKRPMAEHVARVARTLRQYYGALVEAFGKNVDTALSGGYDSRLTLALLRGAGAVPEVHVYGGVADPDVVIAKAIAKGEGFTLIHENKERLGDPSPEGVARAVEAQFWAFDGCPTDGIVGTGSDLATRRARAAGGRLALNGGGGEVFRNFFYIPPGHFSIRDVLHTFYSQFDPKMATAAFSERRYMAEMARKMAAIFPAVPKRLDRAEVEFIYPGFRGRFWTGRNTSLNNAFGPALTPFFDVAPVRDAVRVPLAYKNHGIFEAALIAAIDPGLARYPSAYGHAFDEPPPFARRMKDWGTYLRPPALRRLSYRMKARLKTLALSRFFGEDYRRLYLPEGMPRMARFFHLERIGDSERMNRIVTLEYLARTFGVD